MKVQAKGVRSVMYGATSRRAPPPAKIPVDPEALHLAREFRADPFGHHSPELTRVLSVLRSGPMAGKYCLICTRPHEEWRLGQLSGVRGMAPTIAHNRVYHSLAEAEWEVFKLRWRDATGREIDDATL